MKLHDFVVEQAIIADLQARERDAAVVEMMDALVAAGTVSLSHRDEFIRRVLEREARASTGLGHGVAVPHVKHQDIASVKAAIAVSREGVEFNSLDRQPVYTIFLLLSPSERPEDHLDAMQVIFDNLNQEVFRRFLRQAATTEDVAALLRESDERRDFR